MSGTGGARLALLLWPAAQYQTGVKVWVTWVIKRELDRHLIEITKHGPSSALSGNKQAWTVRDIWPVTTAMLATRVFL